MAVRMGFNASMSTEPNQAHPIEELVIECNPHTRCMAYSPRSFRTEGRSVSQLWIDPTLDQFRLPSAINHPLFPLEAS